MIVPRPNCAGRTHFRNYNGPKVAKFGRPNKRRRVVSLAETPRVASERKPAV